MNELDRMRYLQAMGLEAYVSRRQLPGAAPTRRLVLVPAPTAAKESVIPERAAGRPAQRPQLDVAPEAPTPAARPKADRPRAAEPTVRFSLAAVFVSGIAWVESLGDRPLAREQVQLIRGMARAVHGKADSPKVAQFDWPIHNNPQLYQGESAASAGVAAFLLRHVDEQKCRGLVILGEEAASLIDVSSLGGLSQVVTRSTLEMIDQPGTKRQVWTDLQPLVLRA